MNRLAHSLYILPLLPLLSAQEPVESLEGQIEDHGGSIIFGGYGFCAEPVYWIGAFASLQ